MNKHLIITLLYFKFSFILSNSIFPLKKIVLIDDINNLSKGFKETFNELKGIGLYFNNSSKNNIIPYYLFRQIYFFYRIEFAEKFTFGIIEN